MGACWVPAFHSAVSARLTQELNKKLCSVWFTDYEFRDCDLPWFDPLDSQWQHSSDKKPVSRHWRAAGWLPVLQFLWGCMILPLKWYHGYILPCPYYSKGVKTDKEPMDKFYDNWADRSTMLCLFSRLEKQTGGGLSRIGLSMSRVTELITMTLAL